MGEFLFTSSHSTLWKDALDLTIHRTTAVDACFQTSRRTRNFFDVSRHIRSLQFSGATVDNGIERSTMRKL